MSYTLVLGRADIREKAVRWINALPPGTRVTFEEPRRSTEQNSRLWAMLTEVSEQLKPNGVRYTPDQWKAIFLHAMGFPMQFLPSLDGTSFIPYANRSSKLSVQQMCDLQTFIEAEALQRGVVFSAPEYERAA
jgi:NinB protein